jgi:hypothetical protein
MARASLGRHARTFLVDESAFVMTRAFGDRRSRCTIA